MSSPRAATPGKMPRFANQEIAFDIPGDWIDESRTMFVFPEATTNVTLTKREADPSIPLAEYVRALVRQMAARWPELEVVDAGDVRIGERTGAKLVVEWGTPEGRLRSICRIVFCERELWSFTAMTPVARLDETQAALDRAMASFATMQ